MYYKSSINKFHESSIPAITPRTDFYEDESKYYMELDIPGLEKNDIDLFMKEGVLSVTGRAYSASSPKAESMERIESYRYVRKFRLPKGDLISEISANYEDGVLSVAAEKPKESKSQKIAIA